MDHSKTITYDKHFSVLGEALTNVGATYLSLLIFDENRNYIYSRSSNPEWVHEFISSDLYKHCHLLQAAHEQLLLNQSTSFSLAWDLYSPQTEKAEELNDIRKSKNITHGVGFCIKDDEYTLMLNVAGKYTDVNFGLNVLKNRTDVYRALHHLISARSLE